MQMQIELFPFARIIQNSKFSLYFKYRGSLNIEFPSI